MNGTLTPTIWLVADSASETASIRHDLARYFDAAFVDVLAVNDYSALAEHRLPTLVLLLIRAGAMNVRAKFRALRKDQRMRETPVLLAGEYAQLLDDSAVVGDAYVDVVNAAPGSSEFSMRVRNLLSLGEKARALKENSAELRTAIERATTTLRAQEEETIHLLSRAAEFRDPDTGGHVNRMAAYSEMLARKLRHLHPYDPRDVGLAAPMHDLGKIAMPDRVLLKTGGFTDEEWALMKQHARIGYEVLRDCASPVLRMAAVIALSHHEAWDGNGYPQGHKGHDIPILGRIVAVADVFDALTSTRPYKEAWTVDEALEELRELAGRKLDPVIVEAFLNSRSEIEAIRGSHPGELLTEETAA